MTWHGMALHGYGIRLGWMRKAGVEFAGLVGAGDEASKQVSNVDRWRMDDKLQSHALLLCYIAPCKVCVLQPLLKVCWSHGSLP